MKAKRLAALTLAMLLTLPSCSGGQTESEGAGESAPAETTAAQTQTETQAETQTQAPNLPQVDMGGETYNIFSQGWAKYAPLDVVDIYVEETTGEILNDAAYNRLVRIMETYNCQITQTYDAAGNQGIATITKAVTAGDDAYSIALARSNQYNAFLTGSLLTDLADVPHLQLDAPYYDRQSYDALSLLGKHYGIVSNLSTNVYQLIFCGYFNKAMMADYDLGNLYETVRNGEWTLDTLNEMIGVVSSDLDGNGTFDWQDQYGMTYILDVYEGMLNASGVTLAASTSDGIEALYADEAAITRMQKLSEIFNKQDQTFNVHTRDVGGKSRNELEVGIFIEGRTLFSFAGIYYATQFRDMEDDFGIIPYPKYDTAQADYISPLFSNVFPITVIPRSNVRLDNTGILLEELSYEGYTELLPVLYDTILTGKCARDEDSVETLDIIFSNTAYDIGMLFDFGKVRTKLREQFAAYKSEFASLFAGLHNAFETNVADLMDAVSED